MPVIVIVEHQIAGLRFSSAPVSTSCAYFCQGTSPVSWRQLSLGFFLTPTLGTPHLPAGTSTRGCGGHGVYAEKGTGKIFASTETPLSWSVRVWYPSLILFASNLNPSRCRLTPLPSGCPQNQSGLVVGERRFAVGGTELLYLDLWGLGSALHLRSPSLII